MALEHRQTAPVYAVQYALRVLETVNKHAQGVGAEQLAREIGVPIDYLTHLLAMLRREHYLSALPGGGYAVGKSLVLLGSASRDKTLGDKIKAVLATLRDEVGAAVYFSRYSDGELRVVDIADGPDAPRVNEWIEFQRSAHASAIGKCLLSQLDHDSRREHLSRHKVARFTSHTIVNEKVLLTTLETQPPSAPVLDLQEYAVGTVCAAIPITIGNTVGCLALSLPITQAHRLRPAADALNERAAPVFLAHAF